MEKDYLVTKSNYFIMNTSYDLRLEEQKIILTLASLVQPTDEEFKPYKFKISEFMELLGVDTKTKYTEIPKVTKELMKKVLEIHEGNTLLQVAWLNSARYEKGSGMVTLKFSPDLKPYMLQLKEKFTQYQLANILSMKSKYSSRIYEILKCNEFKKQSYIEIELEELRKLLKIDNMYPQYNDFKRKIIIQTQKELKKLTDINFEFEEIKTGRKVTTLRFYIKSNIKAKNEIAVGSVKEKSQSQKDKAVIEQVQAIIKNIVGNEISDKTAKTFYTKAVKHKEYGNSPFELIEEVAEYSKTQTKDKGFVAWFTGTVEHYIRPSKQNRTEGNSSDTFNDFEQRVYDFEDLENKLLGIK